jgi:tail collar domain
MRHPAVRILVPVGLVASLGVVALAASHTFSNGEVLQAADLNGNFAALEQRIAALEAVAAPPGTVVMYAGKTVPAGWLLCDGRPVSRAMYPALFSAVGVGYGPGDGSTTFALPNLIGKFLMGVGADGIASTGGKATMDTSHRHVPGELALAGGGHFHDLPIGDSGNGLGWTRKFATGAPFARDLRLPFASDGPLEMVDAYRATGGEHGHTFAGTTAPAGDAAADNRPPFVGLLPLIKS